MVLGMVDALLRDAGARDADAESERQRNAFSAAMDHVRGRLAAWERPHFERAVGLARDALVAREDGLYLFERVASIIRRAARALGRHLAEAGHIQSHDDVFFMRRSELTEAVLGRLDVRPRIARRKRAFERISRAHGGGEHWFFASGSAARPREVDKPSKQGVLVTGVGASRGRARGVVRVVRGPHEFSKVQKGDILVAQFTAPAWTPLFSLAGAVVTDIGGALSHAAIVAREYGIPAVLGSGRATATLEDGQRVVVDGTEGWVKLDEKSP
jgi:pyruvate,water dikinase